MAALVRATGIRWSTEENFADGKSLAGLAEHQVRRWTSWYRWVTLACSPWHSSSWPPRPSMSSPRCLG